MDDVVVVEMKPMSTATLMVMPLTGGVSFVNHFNYFFSELVAIVSTIQSTTNDNKGSEREVANVRWMPSKLIL
jgi:hypothetical protein